MAKKSNIDVQVSRDGSMFLFSLLTQKAKNWVKENVNLEPWQWLGDSFAVEHRYALDLSNGMQKSNLVVE